MAYRDELAAAHARIKMLEAELLTAPATPVEKRPSWLRRFLFYRLVRDRSDAYAAMVVSSLVVGTVLLLVGLAVRDVTVQDKCSTACRVHGQTYVAVTERSSDTICVCSVRPPLAKEELFTHVLRDR